ncbi:hypothetical protein BB560_000815 [Smittium megazygosporum]|uniref:Uncharacterized protein n=1 Tax=Smittium megazygosporum TaxID=133381 RepID=A0A2T9ZJH8_9FUNG|nr:hypothetical protein BB560_000815 [Smittium megazygosporum]
MLHFKEDNFIILEFEQYKTYALRGTSDLNKLPTVQIRSVAYKQSSNSNPSFNQGKISKKNSPGHISNTPSDANDEGASETKIIFTTTSSPKNCRDIIENVSLERYKIQQTVMIRVYTSNGTTLKLGSKKTLVYKHLRSGKDKRKGRRKGMCEEAGNSSGNVNEMGIGCPGNQAESQTAGHILTSL